MLIILLFLGSIRYFFMFETSPICSLKLYLFDKKYSKNINIVKNYYNLNKLFSVLIYFKIEFNPMIKA